jgi:hypothetical protein
MATPQWRCCAEMVLMRSGDVAPVVSSSPSRAMVFPLAGCDGHGVAFRQRPIGRVGTTSTSLDFVGTWRRAVYFVDDFGFARSSETSWQFGGDGSAARVLVARNLSVGLVDVLVSAGRYRVENSRLIIELTSPAPSRREFDVRRTGEPLVIAGEPDLRVGG